MPIYKDTFALEACPAKTAESVSYAATFAVLGWLLVSNYSGLGYAEQPIANTESISEDSFTPGASIINNNTASVEAETLDEMPFSAVIVNQPEMANSTFVTAPPAWHANFDLYQHYESHSHRRAFSTAAWDTRRNDAGQQNVELTEELVLPLPLIDIADFFDAKEFSQIVSNGELASNSLSETGLIRGITVKGAEADRLTSRPGNIDRPQIPRPYRAQEIQRSFVLPPRIQAFKP